MVEAELRDANALLRAEVGQPRRSFTMRLTFSAPFCREALVLL